jgi:hypothetical protein
MMDGYAAAFGLGGGVGMWVGIWAALWWRDHIPFGHKQIVRRIYVHVDDLIGATKTENQIRAGKRFAVQRPIWRGGLGRNLGRLWADAWWPIPPQAGGATARPHTKRMAVYVRVRFSWDRPWWNPWWRTYRLWDVEAVTVFWTSEAAALTGSFAENVGRKVAQALRLESVDRLEWDVNWDAGCVRYTRKTPAPEIPTTMPVGVNADA